jgi:TatD DNase family protein
MVGQEGVSETVLFIDAHVHLNQYPIEDASRLVEEARTAGVTTLLTAGLDLATSQRDIESLSALGNGVGVLVGIHPWWADTFSEAVVNTLSDLTRQPRVVGLGEIGLDFVRGQHPEAVQVRAFETMLDLAMQRSLPILLHSDRLDDRTHTAMQQVIHLRGGRITGAVHGFAASRQVARRWLDLGFALSFSGVLTWDERADLRATAADVESDRLLVETDSPAPYPPQQARGQANHPRYAAKVTAALAHARGLDVAETAQLVKANLHRVFPRLVGN